MDRLVIVSNRLPVNIIRGEDGSLDVKPSVGGLATGLKSFYKSYDSLWIGWSGISNDELGEKTDDIKVKLNKERCYPVFLDDYDVNKFYHGFSNNTLWPLFHYFTQHTFYNEECWDVYKKVNNIFLDAVLDVVKPNDFIWIHDYHLLLLPQLIRQKIPDAKIGFFLHIPFPSYEVFRLLPWRKDIIEGFLGSDLIGFHTYDYVRHFFSSVMRLLGYDHVFNQITTEKRVIKVDAFPMGIDYNKFTKVVSKKKSKLDKDNHNILNRKIILSVDRLDYTKGMPQRLEAFDFFLDKYPEYKEKVVLVMLAVPSRTNVQQYKILKKRIDELIGKINGKHGTINWMPIWYLYRSVPFPDLISLYKMSDIALITPLRDGMNLVAKEYIVTKKDHPGVVILSEMAGAAKELGESIIVNPNNKEEIADSIRDALVMPDEERAERFKTMQNRLKRYNVERWANDFMGSLAHIKNTQKELSTKILSNAAQKMLLKDYKKANKRLIFLNYDGTLVKYQSDPKLAKPDSELLSILRELSDDKDNEVVIMSGRKKDVITNWIGDLNVVLVAEHGILCREIDKKWHIIESIQNNWQEEIMPVLKVYVDRTPGSFIEKKEYSLILHYKQADPELKSVRAWELKESLINFATNLNIEIIEGSNLIEITNTNSGTNKVRAGSLRMSRAKHDFILAIGHDWSDEDLFSSLPDSSYTLKVGLTPSQAKFNLESIPKVRKLLTHLISG